MCKEQHPYVPIGTWKYDVMDHLIMPVASGSITLHDIRSNENHN